MLAYKSAVHKGKRVLITLEIPPDAFSNFERSSVAVKETAKYRTNKAKVLKIEDEEGKSYRSAKSAFFADKSLIYIAGETVKVDEYDSDPEEVCSTGIHFFLNKHVAELYGLDKIENGLYQKWYENGQLMREGVFKNGKKEGVWQFWYYSGELMIKKEYQGGTQHGIDKMWYENGQLAYEALYVDGDNVDQECAWDSTGKEATFEEMMAEWCPDN